MCCHSTFVVRGDKNHPRMLAQYTENCIMQRKVYQWVKGFHSGRISSVDEECSAELTTS